MLLNICYRLTSRCSEITQLKARTAFVKYIMALYERATRIGVIVSARNVSLRKMHLRVYMQDNCLWKEEIQWRAISDYLDLVYKFGLKFRHTKGI